MKAPLQLVHKAAHSANFNANGPYRWDASRPAPHTQALRAAWADGEATGFRVGYMKGWRWGLVCGAFCASIGAGAALAIYFTWWR